MELGHIRVVLAVCVVEDAVELDALCDETMDALLPTAREDAHSRPRVPAIAFNPAKHVRVRLHNRVRTWSARGDQSIDDAHAEADVEHVAVRRA